MLRLGHLLGQPALFIVRRLGWRFSSMRERRQGLAQDGRLTVAQLKALSVVIRGNAPPTWAEAMDVDNRFALLDHLSRIHRGVGKEVVAGYLMKQIARWKWAILLQ